MPTSKSKAKAASPSAQRRAAIVCIVAAVVGIPIVLAVVDHFWPYRYKNVRPTLETVFDSQIKIDHYHRIYLPHPGFVADGITLRRDTAPNLPPIGSVDHIRVEGRWIDLLLFRNRIRMVSAQGLHIVIPPVGSQANHEDFPPGSSQGFAGPTTAVQTFDLQNATLDILRVNGGRYSFPIAHLVIHNLQKNVAISYDLDMLNARPIGRIQSHGSFGPLRADDLGATATTGDFTFTQGKLSDIGGIGGTLDSSGSFHGTLEAIEVTANANIADFAVGKGRPTSIAATSSAAVNVLNGDISLHAVDLRLGKTTVHAQGAIAGSPKATNLDFTIATGRAEDILHPFLAGPSPVAGPLQLHSHATLAPDQPGENFFERLTLQGTFDIPAQRLTNPTTEQNLAAFSQRARGLAAASAGDPYSDVDLLSSLGGSVIVQNGVAHASHLDFRLPGATILLNGTFDLRSQTVDMQGTLTMQADVSHVTTGFKSLLLKPLAPFFRKRPAGAVIPIAITGSSGNFKIGSNIHP